MGLFDRFRSAGQAVANSEIKADSAGQDATRLIEDGQALEAAGRLDEAMLRYREAIRLAPNPARAHLNLGNVLLAKGDLQGALNAFATAIKHKPDYAGAYYNMGNALLGNGQYDQAAASYRRALEFQPDYAEVHCALGIALKELGQLDDAISCFQRALEIKPDLVEAHLNLGNALKELGELESAAASYRHALEVQPDFADALSNLGIALQALGKIDDAVQSYRRALEIKPDLAETNVNLGLLLLSMGRYTEAWPKYEARYHPNFKRMNIVRPVVSFPQWQGEPLTGKSMVIWPEQGFGDEIQFARYIPMLKIRGVSRITLVCTSPLKTLLKTLDGADTVISESEACSLPFHDFWVYPMSLPLHFATTVETVPAKLPYLSVLPEQLELWRDRLPADVLKVGLVWKGNAGHENDSNRSLPGLSTLAPLWCVPGVTFVSLQKGQGENESTTPPTGQPIVHLGSDILNFADAASIILNMDLIICVDTAIAHLAGALNKPCWVLLPATGTDWRWLQERTDSPWYPGVMRLFRQTNSGDWSESIHEIARTLENWAYEQSKG